MESDGMPEVYYEVDDGISKRTCSLQEAQAWLYQGYFTSSTRFALREREGKEGEWRTLGELIDRNGRAMPFCEWMSNEEEEEFGRLQEKMVILKLRKAKLQWWIGELEERSTVVAKEMSRINGKMSDPGYQGERPMAVPSTAAEGVVENAITYPQIYPPPGVDPFALLKSCEGSRRKVSWDVAARFCQLQVRFDRCDKKRLVQQTSAIFEEHEITMCTLCQAKLLSTNNVVGHCCGKKHIKAMNGAVCADAFDFWWNTVGTLEVDPSRSVEPMTMTRSMLPQINANAVSEEQFEELSRTSNFSPPGVDPFALLKSCEDARRKMIPGNIKQRFKQLRGQYNTFGKERQMRLGKQIIDLFSEHEIMECTLCYMKIDPRRAIAHIFSNIHMISMNGVVCADAFDFWWNAVKTFQRYDSLQELTVLNPISSVISPQFTLPKGVDPFALLKSCDGGGRKIPIVEVAIRFTQLRQRYSRHDRVRVAMNLGALFDVTQSRQCSLCNTMIKPHTFIVHIGSKKHIENVKTDVCADAFDFWWNAIDMQLERSCELEILQPVPLTFNPPEKWHLQRFSSKLYKCDKSRLDSDPFTMELFRKTQSCLVCKRGSFGCASELIAHVSSASHWNSIVEQKCGLSRSSVDFWLNALKRARPSSYTLED